MKAQRFVAAAAVLTALAPFAAGAELKSGLEVGKSVPAYNVEKCAGGEDGVKVGDKLCYV